MDDQRRESYRIIVGGDQGVDEDGGAVNIFASLRLVNCIRELFSSLIHCD